MKWFRFQNCRPKFRSLFFNFHFLKVLELPFLISQRLKCLRAKSVINSLTDLKRQSKTSWRFLGFFLFSFLTAWKCLLNFECWKWFEKNLERIFDCFGCCLISLKIVCLLVSVTWYISTAWNKKKAENETRKNEKFLKNKLRLLSLKKLDDGTTYNSKQEKFGFRVFYERF